MLNSTSSERYTAYKWLRCYTGFVEPQQRGAPFSVVIDDLFLRCRCGGDQGRRPGRDAAGVLRRDLTLHFRACVYDPPFPEQIGWGMFRTRRSCKLASRFTKFYRDKCLAKVIDKTSSNIWRAFLSQASPNVCHHPNTSQTLLTRRNSWYC